MENSAKNGTGLTIQSTVDDTLYSVFGRSKIDFHPARKQFGGFAGGDGFRVETLNPGSGRKELDTWQAGKKSDGGGGSEFAEVGLDPELSVGITFRRIGAGLQNLGNTCFLNSVLQCLTYTEPLAAYLQSGKHQNSCHIAGFCALCAIQKHVSCALQSTGRSLVPKDLVANLRCISRNFRNARQEDAHEYMVNLLESMHKCCLPSGVPSESPAAYEKSLVHKIFGGHLRSQVQCQQCSYCSNKFDPFLDLSLEIVKADTLPVALRNFTTAELLDGGEKHYQCQQCKQKVKAKKQLTVHKAPYVLTIHLKRFHALDPTRKVDKKVLFDRSLDMKPFVSGSYDGDLKYSLYGVLVHYGHSTHSGHYVCFVRTSSGMWHLLNDNEVRQVSERTVLEQKAYMLFYVRDRRNIAPRKPVDIVRQENMKATVSANIANLAFKQFLMGRAENGSIANGLHAANASSASVNQKGAQNVGILREVCWNKSSFQQNSGSVVLGCLVPPAEQSLSAPLTNDPSSKGASSLNLDQGENLPSSVVSMSPKSVAPKLENGTITNGPIISVSTKAPPSGCIASQPDVRYKLAETSQKINRVLDKGVASEILLGDSNDRTTENSKVHSLESIAKRLNTVDPEEKPNKPSCESSQAKGIPNAKASSGSPSDQAGDGGQEIVDKSVRTPGFALPNGCLQENSPDSMPHRKLKKKLLRYRVPIMHLGLKVFKASLGVRKTKHKKGKRRTLDAQNLANGHLLETSELGPSTSMKYMTISIRSKSSPRKGTKCGSKTRHGAKCSSDSVTNNVDGEFRGKINQNDAVANQQNASELNNAENRRWETLHDGIMSMLTQGLEETTVARWDGLDMSTSSNLDSNATEKISIGYVPDEWDEEYDRGRRKKLRQSKHQFGGPNPFQELASKKTQFKKPKVDRSSSSYQPFRI